MAETIPEWKAKIRKQQAAIRDHPGLKMTFEKLVILMAMDVGLSLWVGLEDVYSFTETALLAGQRIDYQDYWQLKLVGMIEVETCFLRGRVYRITDVGKETLERAGAEGAGEEGE